MPKSPDITFPREDLGSLDETQLRSRSREPSRSTGSPLRGRRSTTIARPTHRQKPARTAVPVLSQSSTTYTSNRRYHSPVTAASSSSTQPPSSQFASLSSTPAYSRIHFKQHHIDAILEYLATSGDVYEWLSLSNPVNVYEDMRVAISLPEEATCSAVQKKIKALKTAYDENRDCLNSATNVIKIGQGLEVHSDKLADVFTEENICVAPAFIVETNPQGIASTFDETLPVNDASISSATPTIGSRWSRGRQKQGDAYDALLMSLKVLIDLRARELRISLNRLEQKEHQSQSREAQMYRSVGEQERAMNSSMALKRRCIDAGAQTTATSDDDDGSSDDLDDIDD